MPTCTRFTRPNDFLLALEPVLAENELLNSLMLGIAYRVREVPEAYGEIPPYFAMVAEEGVPILAAVMTPPFGVILSALADDVHTALPLLAADLQASGYPVPDVSGANPLPGQFAEIWADLTGSKYELEMAQRIYELRQVTLPTGVPGRFTQAGVQHTALIGRWLRAFEVDCFGTTSRTDEQYTTAAGKRIEEGAWYFWEDGGKPVSMALRTRPTQHGISVSGVYTPPEFRRRGYASACVAALSQYLLDEGYQFCSLFTDLANPTSNRIYMQIGYRPIADFDKIKFNG